MNTCTYSDSYGYDPTQELAEEYGRPAVASCYRYEASVCIFHSELCACGEIFCESCRPVHQAECRPFKLEAFKKAQNRAA